ncbi:hypothetical protein FHR81_003603 [Actinoalloteichus hoggarensis]|nr:DUF998 domain-containing protein [Actinoalloteichus hoggarensis]MBB5922546.1 hypothetical protein [Actinoalloteichus hoggarensis]
MTAVFLLCGVIGSLLFVITFLIDGATRPGYRPVRHPVSALALGSRGWVQTTNFIVCGLLMTAGALGILLATEHPWLALAAAVFGLSLVASGVFPMDPMRGYPPGTPEGTPEDTSRTHGLHDWAGMGVFAALPVTTFIATLQSTDLLSTVYSGATTAALVVLFFSFGQAWENDAPRTGLIQRVMIIIGWVWFAVFCGSLLV